MKMSLWLLVINHQPYEVLVGATVGVRPRRTIVDITCFKGKGDDDVSEWLVHCKVAAKANG